MEKASLEAPNLTAACAQEPKGESSSHSPLRVVTGQILSCQPHHWDGLRIIYTSCGGSSPHACSSALWGSLSSTQLSLCLLTTESTPGSVTGSAMLCLGQSKCAFAIRSTGQRPHLPPRCPGLTRLFCKGHLPTAQAPQRGWQ